MKRLNWMTHTPIGSLSSTSKHKYASKEPPTPLESKRTTLFEDFRSGFINQSELSVALRQLKEEE